MKVYKVVEKSKQTFVSGSARKPRERYIGSHTHIIGYFEDQDQAEGFIEALKEMLPATRIMENHDASDNSQYYHMRMEYDFESEEIEVEEDFDQLIDVESVDGKFGEYEELMNMRSIQDNLYPKVRYMDHKNRVYLYEDEDSIDPEAVIEGDSEEIVELGSEA